MIHEHGPLEEWGVEPGTLHNIDVDPTQLTADIEISRQEAQQHKSWDRSQDRVMVEIKGQEGRTVFEHPVQIQDIVREVTIGIRET